MGASGVQLWVAPTWASTPKASALVSEWYISADEDTCHPPSLRQPNDEATQVLLSDLGQPCQLSSDAQATGFPDSQLALSLFQLHGV